jgi:hypothetical protein
MATYAEAIQQHYARVWSEPFDACTLQGGGVHQLPPDFQILVIRRSKEMLAYATRCMSQPEDAERLELHIFTRPSDHSRSDVVEILTAVAHYHRTGRRLGLGHTVNFGKPWQPGSRCTRGLISLPYLDGPPLEWLSEPKIRFLWLVPLTESEVDFIKAHGVEELEEKLEQAGFNYLDPSRPSVC